MRLSRMEIQEREYFRLLDKLEWLQAKVDGLDTRPAWPSAGVSSGGGGSSGTGAGAGCDLWDCLNPYGAGISPYCSICPCTADPWILGLGTIHCGAASVGGTQLLYFKSGDVGHAYAPCLWESATITSAYR